MKNYRFQELIILFTVASTLLYVVFNNLTTGIGSFRFFWAPLSLIIILFTRYIAFTKGPMRFLLLYGILSVGVLQYTLWNYMDDWNKGNVLEDFYNLMVFCAMWSYFWIKSEFRRLALLSKWAFFFILITIIITNVALTIDPLIVRNSANNFGGNIFQIKFFNKTGAAGYGYAQSFVLLIPLLVYHIKTRRQLIFSRKTLIVILLLLLITTLRAQVFANFLVAALIMFLSFIGSKKRHQTYVYLAIFIVIFVFIPSSFYANIFTTLSSYFEHGSVIYHKFKDFAEFMQKPELEVGTDVGTRAERYPILLEALRSNPVFGFASYNSSLNIEGGNHLYWMNKLALWGIPGFLFFLFVLYKIYKTISSSLFDDEIRYYYLLSVLAFIMLGLTKNIAGREPWLMIIVVIPGLYFYPLIQKNKGYRTIQYNTTIGNGEN